MENEDKQINRRSESPPGRILVKIRIPRMPEEVEAEVPPPPINQAEETKNHYCKLCHKSFSSGKALGGHNSSAHVQANKEYSIKKLNSRIKRRHQGSGPAAADNTCTLCGKVFASPKSLFGHMRCHPERDWRGMEPPPSKAKIDSPEQKQNGYEEDGQIGSGSSTANCNLKGWPTGKRGRGPINPNSRAPGSTSEEKEAFFAGRELIRLLGGGESGKQKASEGPESESGLVRIQEREAIDDGVEMMKGKGKGVASEPQNSDTGSTVSLPDNIDLNDESFIGAVVVLANGKRNQKENENRVKMSHKEKGEYICNICGKGFASHQALGGHRSSHNKFKLSIFNAKTEKKPRDAFFDLNMMPEEDQDKDRDGVIS